MADGRVFRTAGLSVALSVGVMIALGLAVPRAVAQAGSGTVTGQVVWGSCLPGPLSAVPGAAQASPGDAGQATPESGEVASPASSQAQPPAGQVAPAPGLGRRLPAGAVLVALEGSTLSTRTDESGRFSLDNVPPGTYWMLAAGPVAGVVGASSLRPNVVVQSAQTLDVGVLTLGSAPGAACRYPLGPGGVVPDATSEGSSAPPSP
jgi:hypothetical protein